MEEFIENDPEQVLPVPVAMEEISTADWQASVNILTSMSTKWYSVIGPRITSPADDELSKAVLPATTFPDGVMERHIKKRLQSSEPRCDALLIGAGSGAQLEVEYTWNLCVATRVSEFGECPLVNCTHKYHRPNSQKIYPAQ
ncbi:hypothetical protein AVEN_126477-1 [Araneus ventricosus]|uniref:Uncharacterized protein n=1 Tax=Araneus ventricosus TaxID=182803 RepID=A0A4Y2RL03_ARAVE|nr:hypothetical protein AVEN_126477-1 [Araneus ventricosus]